MFVTLKFITFEQTFDLTKYVLNFLKNVIKLLTNSYSIKLRVDLPPKAPSFITRVCGFGFHIRRLRFGQARRARSPQIAQALDALQRVFGFPMMSGV